VPTEIAAPLVMAEQAGAGQVCAGHLLNALARTGIEHLELEWRVGRHGPGGFVPGIPEAAWHRLNAALTAAGNACVESRCTEYVDPRSGAKFVSHADGTAHWKTKERLMVMDLDAALRVSAALEKLQPADPNSYAPVPGVFKRYKERWSYTMECWSVDLTRVVSTADIDTDVCTYEVEVELCDRDILFVRPIENVVQWGTVVAREMIGLAGM
jgi:mRNA capping enzyme, beta chain